jgi:murein L,D-transpeptidase YcbB/YkuD
LEHILRFLHLFLLLFSIHTFLYAQPLSVDIIAANIQRDLQTKLTGQNKIIVQHLYSQTGNRPLWIGTANKQKMSQLIQALNTPLYNYKNKPFNQNVIKKLTYMLDNNQFSTSKKAAVYARLDIALSSAFIHLVRFIVQGDIDWELVQKKLKALKESDDIQADWEISPKDFPDEKRLAEAVISGHIQDYLNTLIPMEQEYRQLIKLLKNYRVMDKFPKIKYSNNLLKPGERSSRVQQIKKRLQISGDYPKNAPIDWTFDKRLEKAVKTYQKRYLLKITGSVDKRMTYYLNQPAQKNIQAIITNLDKTKLYPKRFEQEYIAVNIPDFNLRYFRDNEMIMKMGIVVGRIDRPTPIFSDKIEYMVINPTWTIPDNLIKRDLIHVLRDNPSYLEENNIHVFSGNKEINITQEDLDPYEHSDKKVPYRFVQYPGDNNALGRVKFMFPNKYAVYLHDTDNKSLLKRRYKIYSSGCMRVDKPFALLNILLAHAKGTYTKEAIDAIIATDKPKTIRLKKAIPVHILYFTVFEEDGLAYFKNDIYLYDKIIEESAEGHKKDFFVMPKNRMGKVRK